MSKSINNSLMFALVALTSFFLTACSDDDDETVRQAVAEATITHNAGECPQVSGVYRNVAGLTQGALTFAITNESAGTRLRMVNRALGIDGHTFIVDGQSHDERENGGKSLRYTAGCDDQTLTLRGSIDNVDRIDFTINENNGGTVNVREGLGQGEYRKVIGDDPADE